jgi:hypothetical protein
LAPGARIIHLPLVPKQAAQSKKRRNHKMRDEMDSRLWVEHGADFTALMAKVIDAIGISLKRLNEIEFEAPWRKNPQ